MEFLDTSKIKFSKNEYELLSCTYDGKFYESVKILRCFPMSSPMELLSVCYSEDEEVKEIGIISKIDDLNEENKGYVLDDLILRYFIPEIIKINKHRVKNQFQNFYCETTAGLKEIRVKEIIYNLFPTPNGDLLIRDCDENYYLFKDYKKSNDKHLKYIRSFL